MSSFLCVKLAVSFSFFFFQERFGITVFNSMSVVACDNKNLVLITVSCDLIFVVYLPSFVSPV